MSRQGLGAHTARRNLGAVDPRLSIFVPKQQESNIPLEAVAPVLWLVPDDLSILDGAGTRSTSFTDRANNAWSVPTSCSGLRQQEGCFNGRHGLLANPVEIDIMQSTAFSGTANVTVFLAVRVLAKPIAPVSFPVILQKGTVNLEWLFLQDTTNITWRAKSANNADFTYAYTIGATEVWAGRAQGTTTADFYVNGVIQGTTKAPTGALPTTSSAVYLGGNGLAPTSNAAFIQVAEVIVYNQYLANADRNAVERYLGRKYGIPVN